MSAGASLENDSGALPWIAAALLSVLAHALFGVLLLRSAPARTVTPPLAAATDVELTDWPVGQTAPAPESATARAPARTALPLASRTARIHRLQSFRAALARPTPATSPTATPSQAPAPAISSAQAAGASAAQSALEPLPGVPIVVNTPDAISALQLWEAALSEKLLRFKRYPEDSRLRHEEDTVYLRFTVDRAGTVLRVAIQRSRGFTLLDQEALQMLQLAAPLPPLPAALRGDRLNVVVPVEFFLMQGNPISGDSLQ